MIDLDKPSRPPQAPMPQGWPPQGMPGGIPQGAMPPPQVGSGPMPSGPMPGGQPPPQPQQSQLPSEAMQFQAEVAKFGELQSIVSEQEERLASLRRYLGQKSGGSSYSQAVKQQRGG